MGVSEKKVPSAMETVNLFLYCMYREDLMRDPVCLVERVQGGLGELALSKSSARLVDWIWRLEICC